MNLIRIALERPVAVIAAVIMVLLFGAVALQTIPIQLTPDVRKPVLTITTYWFSASPVEIEREVVNRQEDVLRGLEGFGAHTRVHTAKILRLATDLPVVVEIVDTKERIDAFLPVIDEVIVEGLATVEPVEIRLYRSGVARTREGHS